MRPRPRYPAAVLDRHARFTFQRLDGVLEDGWNRVVNVSHCSVAQGCRSVGTTRALTSGVLASDTVENV